MQKERKYDLSERLIEFSVSVIRLSDKVFKTSAGVYLSGQLVRSGTAPALLYGEAQSAESRNDFIHKVKILLKELRETKNNLRIIRTVPLIDDVAQIDAIIQENDELISIFIASVETAKKNQQRK